MTHIKEKTGICESFDKATVVPIRDVVKNGFHCSLERLKNSSALNVSHPPCDSHLDMVAFFSMTIQENFGTYNSLIHLRLLDLIFAIIKFSTIKCYNK